MDRTTERQETGLGEATGGQDKTHRGARPHPQPLNMFIMASSWGPATPPTNGYTSEGPVWREMAKSPIDSVAFFVYHDFIMIS